MEGLHGFYGESHVLHGVDFHVGKGELVTLLGRNGAGRSSTLRAILGLLDRRSGSVRVAAQETIKLPPHRIARLAVGYCPEERGIFPGLSCRENLELLPKLGPCQMHVGEVLELFPNLRTRRDTPATQLSGGEQQMLALARILRTGATLLLLDEVTEGLAPVIVQQIGRAIRVLKERGFTIVLVEQNFRFAAPLADRHYVIERGKVVKVVDRSELQDSLDELHKLLGV